MISKLFNRFRRTFLTKKFLLFFCVGLFDSGVDMGVSTLLSSLFSLQINAAKAVGYATALLCGYFLNSFFTFHQSPSFKRLIKYILSYVPTFLLQQGLVFLCGEVIGLPDFLAHGIAILFAGPVTFLVLNAFAFKPAKEQKPEIEGDSH